MACAEESGRPCYVQYGCGWHAPESWINFDASPTLRIERWPLVKHLVVKNSEPFPPIVEYGDIVAGLPIPEGTCELLYCSHVLEHLSLADCAVALTNSFRTLKPGGTWRMVLPDLRAIAALYLDSDDPAAAEVFMDKSGLGVLHRPKGVKGRVTQAFGNSRHLWMWDYESLAGRLRSVGFREIRRASFGDSEFEAFSDVEQKIRWDGALGIECRRPS
jgi:predicted SAM-dependent methyltransferase